MKVFICSNVLFNFLSCVLLSVLSQEGVVVGVDMEWQPTFGCISTQQVALIQLAVSDQVFLIDLCARRFCEHPETVRFIRSLFSQQSVLKLGQHVFSVISKSFAFFFFFFTYFGLLHFSFYHNSGYGMAGDLKCLLATWPQLQEDPLKMEGMLDLLSIHKKVIFPFISIT